MLLYQLIPHFLAAQITSNNDSFGNGPEYIFSGNLKMVTSLERDKGLPLGTITQLTLKCRPREPDILRCQMEDTKISRLKPKAYDIYQAEQDPLESFQDIGIIKTPFEIKFNENGIDSYIFEKSDSPIPVWSLNMARLVANQFTFGADLSDKKEKIYRGWENFTVGECETAFVVKRQLDDKVAGKMKNYTITPLEKLGTDGNEILSISKDRDLGKCLRCVQSFFGTRYTLGVVLKDVFTHLKSSQSIIHVSKHRFTSETVNESDLYGEDRIILGKVLDHIKISLEKILPGKGEVPKFVNPVRYGMLPDIMEDKSPY